MKKLLKVALVAGCMMLIMGNFAKAQSKIGYIDQNALVTSMPELKTVQTQIGVVQKQWADTYQGLQLEFQNKAKEYDAKKATMTDATRATKEAELQDLQKRAGDIQTQAQQAVEAKGQELMKPLLDKAHVAIEAVAKEKGYNYVLDSSTTSLLISPPADDMLAAVKAKLGLK